MPDALRQAAHDRLIVVTGATASGKTDLAVQLAQRLGTEIVSADSRQMFRGMPITTAVPDAAQLAAVRHHFVEFLDPADYYSAAEFERQALPVVSGLIERNGSAVVCGGSMMYIDALIYGIDDMPTVDDAVRQKVHRLRHEIGDAGLLALLQVHDPAYYAEVDRANMRRVMHALELCFQTGQPYSNLRTGRSRTPRFNTLKLAIDMPRAELFDRINRRVEAMVEAGMEDEARRHLPLRHLNALNTVGFKEWFDYFDGKFETPRQAIDRIAKNTRVYAKKQLTWLQRDPSVVWLDATNPVAAAEAAITGRADFQISAVSGEQ